MFFVRFGGEDGENTSDQPGGCFNCECFPFFFITWPVKGRRRGGRGGEGIATGDDALLLIASWFDVYCSSLIWISGDINLCFSWFKRWRIEGS